MTTGEKIREARKKAGFTQKRLSELTGIAEPTIRKYESGRLNPKIETLKKIAEPLGTYYFELYGELEEAEAKILFAEGAKLGSKGKYVIDRSKVEAEFYAKYKDKGYEFTEFESDAVLLFNRLTDTAKESVIQYLLQISLDPKNCKCSTIKNMLSDETENGQE